MARRGPVPGSGTRPSSAERALSLWGDGMPTWVLRLAEECDRTTQGAVASRIGRSASALSQVLGNRYPGDMEAFEETVIRVLGGNKLDRPELGPIEDAVCGEWRAQARNFAATNPERVRMYWACQSCRRFKR